MNRSFRKVISVFLCLFILFTEIPAAAADAGEVLLYTEKLTRSIPMWHYSGGYWIIGSGADKVKVSDSTVEKSGGLQHYLEETAAPAAFSVTVPEQVRNALQNGRKIRMQLESRGNASWTELFDQNTLTVTKELSSTNSTVEFTLMPKFNLLHAPTFDDFVSGLKRSVPLIHYRFGNNIYSVYGNGVRAVQANGWFSQADAGEVHEPYLHPSMIRDSSGAFIDSGILSLNGKTFGSKGFSAGNNTFQNGGAVGISFVWPLDVSFYQEAEKPELPVDPTDPEDPVPPGGPGKNDPPADPATPENPEQETSMRAILELPEECYEGEWIEATDCSEFDTADGTVSAHIAYASGLAEHSFRTPGATRDSRTSTSVRLKYDQDGTYCVTLDVDTADGKSVSVSRSIRVLPCPRLSVSVGGTQKQNRRQSLLIRVRQSPDFPVRSLSIRLEDPESGESICTERNSDGPQAAPVNTENLKYRALCEPETTGEVLSCRLDFLTKFSETRTLRYTVTVTDSRGRTDTADGSFTVIPDTPPAAGIQIADVFYREKGSNTAVISAEDGGETAGNYQRTWEYADGEAGTYVSADCLDGFEDLSLGNKKEIRFRRNGVGTFRLRLTVKDLWAEETLEEYVCDADHLQASAEACGTVGNLAPVVSLETRKAATAQILLLTEHPQTQVQMKATAEELRVKLAAAGISAAVFTDTLCSSPDETGGTVSFGGQIPSPACRLLEDAQKLDHRFTENFWKDGHYTADGQYIYLMDSSTLVSADGKDPNGLKRSYPFYISAIGEDTHKERWRFTFSENVFLSDSDFQDAKFGHDVQNRFLYLSDSGKTLLLDKENGTPAGIMNGRFGAVSYAADDKIYTFREDGIFCASLRDGSVSCIRRASVAAEYDQILCFGNRMLFCENDTDGIWLCSFDPETETTGRILLNEVPGAICKGVDTRGYVFILEDPHLLKAYDSRGVLIGSAALDPKVDASVLSRDSSGRVNYILGSYREKTGSTKNNNVRKYNYATISGIFSSFSGSSYFRSEKNGYYRSNTDIGWAVELADGIVSGAQPCRIVTGDNRPTYSFSAYNFNTRTGESDHRILCQTGMPANAYSGTWPGGIQLQVYDAVSGNIGMHVRIPESREDELKRLQAKWIRGDADVVLVLRAEQIQSTEDAVKLVLDRLPETEKPAAKTYRTGEVIDYRIFYSDYEGDPSGASYWIYTHEPADGDFWEDSGKTFSGPVRSFEKAGKYTLTHWQKDDAGRGILAGYDKPSVPVTLVFYVEEAGTEDPPAVPETVPRSLTGDVEHTPQWESNRQAFNLRYFRTTGFNAWSSFPSYRGNASPRLRGINVFWPGERLLLNAAPKGDVQSVSACIQGTSYHTTLTRAADGSFTGSLYDASMAQTFHRNRPLEVTVRFTAIYTDGTARSYDVPIIFDQDIGYWMIHRTY